MIQVRDTYRIKFGKIDQAVDQFNRLARDVPAWPKGRDRYEVLTDLSGEMFTLVTALHMPSLAEWEAAMPTLVGSPQYQTWFKDFKQFVEDGERCFFVVEQANDGWQGPGAVMVRSCFRCREWRIAEAVDLVKTYGAMLTDCGVGSRPRILTDASGKMFNVVIEIETPDLKVWDDHRRTMFRDPQFQVWFLRLTACVEGGSHTFYTVAGPKA
jgi:hypothetical protein